MSGPQPPNGRLEGLQAVLLDMDGTLVESDAAVERAWRQWAQEYGVDAKALLAGAHGNPAQTTVRAARPDLGGAAVDKAAARQLELQYDDLSDVVAAPGAFELLDAIRARRLGWAVVTSADRRLAQARLGAAGIDPPVLVTVEDIPRGKPEPDGYLSAARTLDADPTRCLVVEDSPPGVEAGRRAGAVVAALRGLDGDLPLTDLGQLAAFLLVGKQSPQ